MTTARVERASLPTTLAVVGASALIGVACFALVEPVAEALDREPGLVEYTVFAFTWNLGLLVLLAATLPRIERTPARELVASWWIAIHSDERVGHPGRLWVAIVVTGVVSLSPLRLWFVDLGWDLLPGPEWSINSPDANRGDPGITITTGVLAFQLLIRIPLTVFVEETLFRGWVQDRHGPVVSGVLFAAYHLPQWWTILALLPFGIALGLLRVITRSIWPGAVLHGGGNAVYAFGLT